MSSIGRIILIDDDEVVHKICKHVINKSLPAIELCMFTSPVAGLEFIKAEYKKSTINTILLLDINMPALNGWEVLEELAGMEEIIINCLSIYIFSSSVSYEDKALSEQHPLVIGFLEKPLTKQKLVRIINEGNWYTSKRYDL